MMAETRGSATVKRGFAVESVLLCDDIRREDNGKAILIGVYSGDMIVPQFPTLLRLSLWMQGTTTDPVAKIQLKAQIADEKGHLVSQQELAQNTEFTAAKGEPFVLALGMIMTQLNSPGMLSILVQFNDDEWSEVLAKKVLRAPVRAEEGQG